LLQVYHSALTGPGADATSNVRGGAISIILGSKVSLPVRYCKRDEVYFIKLL